ncbi:MAG: type II toxin-antitoxin system RelE/ParE family toxin [Sulfuricella sp.]
MSVAYCTAWGHILVAHPNYLLIYRIQGETIEILRVKHALQQWP